MFNMASAMSNTGFFQGIMNKDTNNFVLWVLSLGMVIGRLEFTIIFIVMIKLFKDITKRKTYIKEDSI